MFVSTYRKLSKRMKKTPFILPLLLSVMFFQSNAKAADLYSFAVNANCTLKKNVNKKWEVVTGDEVQGESLVVIPSKSNKEYSNFFFKGSWFAAKTDCFILKSETNKGAPESTIAKHYFVDLRLSDIMMNGSGTSGLSTTAGIVTNSTGKYSPGLGFSLRLGKWLNQKSALYFEMGYFSGSQPTSLTQIITYNGTLTEKIYDFHLGYQYYFSKKWMTPFVGASIGYNRLTGVGLESPYNWTYSSSGIGEMVEVGAVKDFSKHFSATLSLSYTLMSFNTMTIAESNSTSVNVAGSQYANAMGYSHLGINLGGRYSF